MAEKVCNDKDRVWLKPGIAPKECSGEITHEFVWATYRLFYCEAHGSFHQALSPFAGYRRIKEGE